MHALTHVIIVVNISQEEKSGKFKCLVHNVCPTARPAEKGSGASRRLGEKSAEREVRQRRSFMSRLPFAGSGQEAATHNATSGRPNGRVGSAASKPAPFAEREKRKGCGTRKVESRRD